MAKPRRRRTVAAVAAGIAAAVATAANYIDGLGPRIGAVIVVGMAVAAATFFGTEWLTDLTPVAV